MIFPFNLYKNDNLLSGIDAKIEYSVPNLELKNNNYIEIPKFKNLSNGGVELHNPFIDFKIYDFNFGDKENIRNIVFTLLTHYPSNLDDQLLNAEKELDTIVRPIFSNNEYLFLKEIPEESFGKLTQINNDISLGEDIFYTAANHMSPNKNTSFNITSLIVDKIKNKSDVICFRIFRLDDLNTSSTGSFTASYSTCTPFILNNNLLKHYNDSKKTYFDIINGQIEISNFDTSKNLLESYEGDKALVYHKLPELDSIIEFPIYEFNSSNINLNLKYVVNKTNLLTNLHLYIDSNKHKIRIKDVYGKIHDYIKINTSHLNELYNANLPGGVLNVNLNDFSYVTYSDDGYILCINKTMFYKYVKDHSNLYKLKEIYNGDVLVYNIEWDNNLVSNIRNETKAYHENVLNSETFLDNEDNLNCVINFININESIKLQIDYNGVLQKIINFRNEIVGIQDLGIINNIDIIYENDYISKIYDNITQKGIYINRSDNLINVFKYTSNNTANSYDTITYEKEENVIKIIQPNNIVNKIYFDENLAPFLQLNGYEKNTYNNQKELIINNYQLNNNYFNKKELSQVKSFLPSIADNNLIKCSKFDESLDCWEIESSNNPSSVVVQDDYLNDILGENAYVVSMNTGELYQEINKSFNQGDLLRLEFWLKIEETETSQEENKEKILYSMFSVALFNDGSIDNNILLSEKIITETGKYKHFVFYCENKTSCNSLYFNLLYNYNTSKLFIKNVKLHKVGTKSYDDYQNIEGFEKYDNENKLLFHKKGLNVLEYTYNNKNLITKIKNHVTGEEISYEYDSLNNVTKEIKSNNYNITDVRMYEYYLNGLLKKVIDNNNNETIFNYDYNNNIVDIVNSDGRSYTYKYNDINLINKIKSYLNDDPNTINYTYENNQLKQMSLNTFEDYVHLYNEYLLDSGYNYKVSDENYPMISKLYSSSNHKQIEKIINYLTPKTVTINNTDYNSPSEVEYSYENDKLSNVSINNEYKVDYKYTNNKISKITYPYDNGKNKKEYIGNEYDQDETLKHTYNENTNRIFDTTYFKNSNNKILKFDPQNFKQMYLYNNLFESSIILEIEKYNSNNINDYIIGSMPIPLYSVCTKKYHVLDEFDQVLHSNVLLFNNKKHYSEIDLLSLNEYRIDKKSYGNVYFNKDLDTVKNELDLILLFNSSGNNVDLFTLLDNNGGGIQFNINNGLNYRTLNNSSFNNNNNLSNLELNKWHILRVAVKMINGLQKLLINLDGINLKDDLVNTIDESNNYNNCYEKIILGNYYHDEEEDNSALKVGYFSINPNIDYNLESITSTEYFIKNISEYLENNNYNSHIDIILNERNYDIIDFNKNLVSLNKIYPKSIDYTNNYDESKLNDLFKFDKKLNKYVLNLSNRKKYDNQIINNIICYDFTKSYFSNFMIKFKVNNHENLSNSYQNLLCYKTVNSFINLFIHNNQLKVRYLDQANYEQIKTLDYININEWNNLIFKLNNNKLYVTLNNENIEVNLNDLYLEDEGLLYLGYNENNSFLDGYIEYIKFSSDNSIDLTNENIIYYNKNYLTNDFIKEEQVKYGNKELVKQYEKIESTYDNGLPNVVINYDNTITYYKYNKDGLLVGLSTYDDDNNILLEKYYYYDSYGQLIKEENKDYVSIFNNYIFIYEYDLNGNIIKKQEYTIEEDLVCEYEYNYDLNIPNTLLNVIKKLPNGTSNIEYNITYFNDYIKSIQYLNKNGINYKIKYLNNLITSIGNNKYYYDDQGLRIKKITETNDEFVYYYENNKLVKMDFNIEGINEHNISYLYDENNQLIGLYFKEKPYFYNRDLTGNINSIVDINGKTMVKYYYNAYGKPTIITLDETDIDYNLSVYLSKCNVLLYKGYIYDVETQLYWLSSRYYSPELCRFISPDDIEYLDPESINGLNLYCYCMNNPIMYADPSGHLPKWAWKLIIGTSFILIGALVTAATAGAGTAFWAALGSALLTSTIQVGISTAVSAGLGFIAGGLSTGTWEGAFTGMLDGAVDGYMWGGIISGGSQILSGLMKGGNGISIGRVDALYKSENSTTLFNYNNAAGKSRFRIDVAKGKVKYPGGKTGFLSGKELNGLHYHFGKSNSLRDLHRFFTPGIVNGFISSGLGYFFKLWRWCCEM